MKIFRGSFLIIFSILLLAAKHDNEPKEVLLWPNGAPGSEGKIAKDSIRLTPTGERIVSRVNFPSITPYTPTKDKATGAAIIIAPGGGHSQLSIDHEGYNVARWLSEHGIAGFVLKNRLAREPNSIYTIDGDELSDMQRAIRLVRSRSKEWGIDTNRIGVLGFSAGGELAALASTRFDTTLAKPADRIDKQSVKPAFQALIYPGNSSRFTVSKNSPPVFIVCGYKDRPDISRGMAELYLKYKDAGIPAELHVYAGSGHGFGLRESDHKPSNTWPARLYDWMDDMGFLKGK